MEKTVAFCTLGCKVNQYETNAMIEQFIKKGYTIKEFNEKADIYIINTCTVTNMADRKSRQMLRRAKELNSNSILVACGCYAQVAKEELEKIPEIDLIYGTNEKNKIAELVDSLGTFHFASSVPFASKTENDNNIKETKVTDVMYQKEFLDFGVTDYTEKTRAVIKVQDGCDRFCSYCIIPYARGHVTSSQIQKVVEEKKQWILNKIKEYEIACEEKDNYTKLKTIKVLGKNYDLVVNYKRINVPSLEFAKNQIQITLPIKFKNIESADLINILMEKMYEKIAEKEIERAMEKTRIMLEIAPEDYEIKNIEGSIATCKDKKITINPNIAMYSKDVIDYIVLHEFCHLKYKNHTKSFYNMIKTYMPNYEEKAKELNGIAY